MGSALWAGISGLTASSKELDVIANNLANTNTIGYKSSSTIFADVLSSSLSGGSSGTMQVGRGVSVSAVQTNYGTGSFETTGNATDVAIDGDGFFMVNDSSGATYYTRAGSFHLNADGLLVDTNGLTLQGQVIQDGVATGALTDINLQGVQSEPSVTTTISLGVNLNSETAAGGTYNTTQTVYDSLGASHTLNMSFTRTEASGEGYWGVQAALDSRTGAELNIDGLIFDSDGNLTGMYTGEATAGTGVSSITLDRAGMVYQSSSGITLTQDTTTGLWSISDYGGYDNATIVNPAAAGTAADPLEISLDGTGKTDVTLVASATTATFTLTHAETTGLSNIDIDLTGLSPALESDASIGNGNHLSWDLTSDTALNMTQYATSSVIRAVSADGYASGQLKSLSIDEKGVISGFFTNGQTAELAQIVLASFPSPQGLKKMGSNLYGETVSSGSPVQNTPGDSGMGSLSPNSLEMSNTDIAAEFIKMITAQKAYQANAKVITTEDSLNQVLMNIKS